MDTSALLNLTIGFSGIFLCLLGLLQVIANTWIDRPTRRYSFLFFSSLLLFAASNAAGLLMRGKPGPCWRAALFLSNFLEFLFPLLLTVFATYYLLYLLDPERRWAGIRRAAAALLCIHVLLLIVSQFTGLFYVIDEANVYHRSPGYPLSCAPGALLLLMDMGLLIRSRERLERKERLAFWIFFSVPFAAMIVQIFVYGFYFVVFATVLAALAMDMLILGEQTKRYLRQEKQLADMRVNMLLSQIRPHFIFNTLTSIYVLCRDDPPRAMEVVQDFSDYLQSNFTAIAATNPIIFLDELRHTKAYLAVEMIRYGDNLTVEYDIKHTSFRLPALTLQPLVENAVKYGVGNGHGPERIAIRTEADGNGAVLRVEDTGPGFDPAIAESGKHVGLRNVRERVERMCGGSLEIQSSPEFGTVVTVRLPGDQEGPPKGENPSGAGKSRRKRRPDYDAN